jgi:hypothetical protein
VEEDHPTSKICITVSQASKVQEERNPGAGNKKKVDRDHKLSDRLTPAFSSSYYTSTRLSKALAAYTYLMALCCSRDQVEIPRSPPAS